MPLAHDIAKYKDYQREFDRNGCFLDHGPDGFVVGPKKHKKKWEKLLDKHEDQAPVAVVDSLDEARAFVIGFTIALEKKWVY